MLCLELVRKPKIQTSSNQTNFFRKKCERRIILVVQSIVNRLDRKKIPAGQICNWIANLSSLPLHSAGTAHAGEAGEGVSVQFFGPVAPIFQGLPGGFAGLGHREVFEPDVEQPLFHRIVDLQPKLLKGAIFQFGEAMGDHLSLDGFAVGGFAGQQGRKGERQFVLKIVVPAHQDFVVVVGIDNDFFADSGFALGVFLHGRGK